MCVCSLSGAVQGIPILVPLFAVVGVVCVCPLWGPLSAPVAVPLRPALVVFGAIARIAIVFRLLGDSIPIGLHGLFAILALRRIVGPIAYLFLLVLIGLELWFKQLELFLEDCHIPRKVLRLLLGPIRNRKLVWNRL